jgi:hypothetical protein
MGRTFKLAWGIGLGDAGMSDRRGDDSKQPAGKQFEPWLQVENEFTRLTAALDKLEAALARSVAFDHPPLPPKICA